jgi:hypothetical protein
VGLLSSQKHPIYPKILIYKTEERLAVSTHSRGLNCSKMNVTFSNQDPLNTSVIDLETDETLFTVYTESKFMGGQTKVRKPGKLQRASSSSSSDAGEDSTIAQVDWHKTRPSVVRIGRRAMPLNMFLHPERVAFGL